MKHTSCICVIFSTQVFNLLCKSIHSSGVAVGIGHPKWFIENTIDKGWKAIVALSGSGSTNQQSYTDDTTDEDSLSNGGLKVVGVGYGRTGTYSLALALEELGFPTLVSDLV